MAKKLFEFLLLFLCNYSQSFVEIFFTNEGEGENFQGPTVSKLQTLESQFSRKK